jgi:hypothetical protein
MAQQTINVGSGEYAGDGESLRSALIKTNENFTDVYENITYILSTATTDQLVNGDQHVVLGSDGTTTFPDGTTIGSAGFTAPLQTDFLINTFTDNTGDPGTKTWTFGQDGKLTLPEGGQIINLDIDGGDSSV